MDQIYNAYKIGTKLYRYIRLSGIHEYQITCVRQYAEEFQYEAKCKTMRVWEDEVLLAHDDKPGRLKYVHMLNDDEDERSYMHTDLEVTTWFYPELSQAQQQMYETSLSILKDELTNAEERVKKVKADIAKIKDLISVAKGVPVTKQEKNQ